MANPIIPEASLEVGFLHSEEVLAFISNMDTSQETTSFHPSSQC